MKHKQALSLGRWEGTEDVLVVGEGSFWYEKYINI